jgi:glycosyltransferase involved in cell wall biosynthesis
MRARSVLHAADYGAGYSGNFIASLRSLSGPCEALGLRVVLGFSDAVQDRPWARALRDEGVPVHFFPRAAPLRERAAALARVARAEHAAVIHTHFTTFDVPAAIASAALGGGPRVVWHLHSPFPPRTLGWAAKNAVKLRLLGRAARVATVSDAILRQVLEAGFPPERAFSIPNGVDLAHACRPSLGREAMRRELELPEHAAVALLFGWEPLRKGVDVAIEAVGALAAAGRELVLLLVGTDALEEFVRARLGWPLPRWVRLVRPQECVADLYAAADLFLSASRAEGLPYAVGEALANGLPILASDIAGLEWARQLDGVLFFPSGDAAALARAIASAVDWPPARREAWRPVARAVAGSRLSLEGWAQGVAAIYRAALEPRRREAREPRVA